MVNGSTVQPEPSFSAMVPRWLESAWLVVDLETTGLGAKDSIIEIGAVIYEEKQVIDSFSALVNPHRPLPAFITSLTGLNDEVLAQAQDLHAVFPRFSSWIEVACQKRKIAGLIAHNVAFDWGFLARAQQQCSCILPPLPPYDTLSLARYALPKPAVENHRLTTLREHFELGGGQHRALDDALATGLLFYELSTLIDEQGKQPLDFASPAYPLVPLDQPTL